MSAGIDVLPAVALKMNLNQHFLVIFFINLVSYGTVQFRSNNDILFFAYITSSTGDQCESDCRSRSGEFYPGLVPYFRED